MDGSSTEDFGTGGMLSQAEGISAGQRCQSVDSLAEWRSSEQLENGTPSTSPPYWDTDDDDDDCGPRPSELYGKFTWKIENYSQINKRELRSNAFEVGGYKWYILIYPQGCDVCNHLSLFLCVANHDKLLPGWSHFAQFTIAVVNKDPKKSKFSDTLHRFWKKEHDWGWKKFMELTKVEDGFVNNETLVIKAQVQVIREKAHRPFRCLDCQYRRELVRVYLSNVEQICRRFFEDRKNKLSKLIEDKVRWSSFCSFWLGIDQNSRRRISRDKLDTILRVVVKHFFVEKEVTSTLVMDSLYSGLKALECQNKNKKEAQRIEMEDSPAPMVRIDKDMFVLADDVILLLERVASEPLPAMSLPPKDDKVSQNRTKEGSSADDFKDSIERDERRLTELGRRTVEIFVLAHIFSRIEVAYQEAVALKRQEELIREEEAAGQAEHELKAKRAAAEKDKRAKKKQGKQKRNNRKNKDKQRDLKSDSAFNDKNQEEKSLDDVVSRKLSIKHVNAMNIERMDTPEDGSDVSCNGDDVTAPTYPDLEDRDSSSRNWDTDASELHPSVEASASELQNYRTEKINLGMDDSSSTCSTDSVPSVIANGYSMLVKSIRISPNLEKNDAGKFLQNNSPIASSASEIHDNCSSAPLELEGGDASQKHLRQLHECHSVGKHEPAAILLKKTSKAHSDAEKPLNIRTSEASSAFTETGRKMQTLVQPAKQSAQNSTTGSITMTSSTVLSSSAKELPSSSTPNVPKRSAAQSAKSPHSSASRSEAQRPIAIPAAKSSAAQPATPISRPSSAPLIPLTPRPITPTVSAAPVTPLLPRSASAIGRLAVDPSLSSPTYVPQSYRNAIIGKSAAGSTLTGFSHSASTYSSQSASSSTSTSMYPPPSSSRKEQQMSSRPGLTFGSIKPDTLPIPHQLRDDHLHHASTSATDIDPSNSNLQSGIERVGVVDEFPHLDIINDLLNEEHSIMGEEASISNQYYYHHPRRHPHHQQQQHHHHSFQRQYSFVGDASSSSDFILLNGLSGRFDQGDQYYDDDYLSLYGGPSGRPLEGLRDSHFAPVDLSEVYVNCQMDGLIQSQWPYGHTDLSLLNLSNTDGGMYSYNHNNPPSDYANLRSGMNGYGLYRP